MIIGQELNTKYGKGKLILIANYDTFIVSINNENMKIKREEIYD